MKILVGYENSNLATVVERLDPLLVSMESLITFSGISSINNPDGQSIGAVIEVVRCDGSEPQLIHDSLIEWTQENNLTLLDVVNDDCNASGLTEIHRQGIQQYKISRHFLKDVLLNLQNDGPVSNPRASFSDLLTREPDEETAFLFMQGRASFFAQTSIHGEPHTTSRLFLERDVKEVKYTVDTKGRKINYSYGPSERPASRPGTKQHAYQQLVMDIHDKPSYYRQLLESPSFNNIYMKRDDTGFQTYADMMDVVKERIRGSVSSLAHVANYLKEASLMNEGWAVSERKGFIMKYSREEGEVDTLASYLSDKEVGDVTTGLDTNKNLYFVKIKNIDISKALNLSFDLTDGYGAHETETLGLR